MCRRSKDLILRRLISCRALVVAALFLSSWAFGSSSRVVSLRSQAGNDGMLTDISELAKEVLSGGTRWYVLLYHKNGNGDSWTVSYSMSECGSENVTNWWWHIGNVGPYLDSQHCSSSPTDWNDGTMWQETRKPCHFDILKSCILTFISFIRIDIKTTLFLKITTHKYL